VGGPHGETDAVVARIFERVDRDEDGVISLQEFVRNILRQTLVGGTTADTVQDARTTANSKQSRAEQLYAQRLESQQRRQAEEARSLPPMQGDAALRLAKLDGERRRQAHANQVLETFMAKLDARRAFIVDSFRFVTDRSADGRIGADCFRKVVRDKMAMHLPAEDLEALVYRFFATDGVEDYESRRITLRDFRKVLNGGWTGAQPEN
jgi:Ca2+-binding EF-hand superfamily protein